MSYDFQYHGEISMENNISIIHPRPSSIVAALYTLRDLNVDVAILHGPPGCSFKHARLLEEDGIHVVTTGLDENGFVFGGRNELTNVIQKVNDMFHPKLIGIVGTCASMIIGEELHEPVVDANIDVPIVEVEVHAGYANNTKGVLITLQSALDIGVIDQQEFDRQKILLEEATTIEKKHGAASKEYIAPSRGDLKYKVAQHIIQLLQAGKKGIVVMNAKKETSYMFIDINVAIEEIAYKLGVESNIIHMVNLNNNVGLPRVRNHANNIIHNLEELNIDIDEVIGGLDEYSITGDIVNRIIDEKYKNYDFIVISGVPHAISVDNNLKKMDIISITNGPRQVQPLKEMGHKHVVVELDLHPKTLGVEKIIESEFGATLREIAKEII